MDLDDDEIKEESSSSSEEEEEEDSRREIPYSVSVGRLHAFDVVPRIVIGEDGKAREDMEFHEREEGLLFADRFGIGVSLYFKIGKLLVFVLSLSGLLQMPALVWYAHRGQFKASEAWTFPRRVTLLSGPGGATLARVSMAAVVFDYNKKSGQIVTIASSLATIVILAFASSARRLVNRDLQAMRALAPRPEHYALMLRDVAPSATAAKLRHMLIDEHHLVRLAVHHVLRPRLQKAVERMALEEATRRNIQNLKTSRFACLKRIFQSTAKKLHRQRTQSTSELDRLAQLRGPASVAFIIFNTPKAARSALHRLRLIDFKQTRQCTQIWWRKVSAAPSPFDLIWENLEVSKFERLLRRLLVRFIAIVLTFAGALAALSLRGEVLVDWSTDDDDEDTKNSESSLAPYLRRGRRRHGLVLVLLVVVMNAILRFVVRRGSVFEAHYARSTEQSAAVAIYFMATTMNTLACYALAAWRQAANAEFGSEATQIWYAEVSAYFFTTLLWEALAPPVGAASRFFCRKLFRLDERRDQLLRDGTCIQVNLWSHTKKKVSEATPLFSARPDASLQKSHKSEPSLLRLAEQARPEQRAISSRRRRKRSIVMNNNKVFFPRPNTPSQNGILTLIANYLAAPNWDATARSADLLRVYFLGAVFSAGQPLMPWLAAVCIVAMVAHDKWALLRDRRQPPYLGSHLALTVVGLAPLAAPAHAMLALWSWSDRSDPFFKGQCSSFSVIQRFCTTMTKMTLPFAFALFLCLATLMLPAFCLRVLYKKKVYRHRNLRSSSHTRRTSPTTNKNLPWREACKHFERKNIPYLYDVYDDQRPLERSRHPDFFRYWSVLDNSTTTPLQEEKKHEPRRTVSEDNHQLATTVLQVLKPPRGFSDSWFGQNLPPLHTLSSSTAVSTDLRYDSLTHENEMSLITTNADDEYTSADVYYPHITTSVSSPVTPTKDYYASSSSTSYYHHPL